MRDAKKSPRNSAAPFALPPSAGRAQARGSRARRGAALMITMFMIFLVTILVVNILDTETLEMAAVRNSIDHEKALYLANAGFHAALAELEAAPAWRGAVTSGSYPSDDTYTATAVDAGVMVTITARGASGGIIRTVTGVVEP
jgi:Tfp pilus assembly protein PilX